MTDKLEHVLITRPEEPALRTAQRANALGLAATVAPLLKIKLIPIPEERLDQAQAFIFTSANGVRAFAASAGSGELKDTPAFAVGPATADRLRQAGFAEIHQGDGNVKSLRALVRVNTDPSLGRIVYCAGRVHSPELEASLVDEKYDIETLIVYDAMPSSSGAAILCSHLRASPDLAEAVLFYSPRSARLFRDLVEREDLKEALSNRQAFCLSEAVRQPIINLPFRSFQVSSDQSEEALFSLLGEAL